MITAIKKLLLTALLLCALSLKVGTSPVSAQSASGQHIKGILPHNGINRQYILYVPANLGSGSGGSDAVPLVLGLHQGGGRGPDFERLTENGWNELADQHGFLVVYPDAYSQRWNNGMGDPTSPAYQEHIDDVAFLRALVGKLNEEYPIDPARIYATGLSSGAIMALRLACEAADLVAAVAPVAGQTGKSLEETCVPSQPVSVMLIVGSADPIVPNEGGEIPGGYGAVLSVEETVKLYTQSANCPAEPESETPDDLDPDDGTTILKQTYAPCDDNSSVIVITVQGGGHTWPQGWQFGPKSQIGVTSQEFDANAVIWEFFSQHSRSS